MDAPSNRLKKGAWTAEEDCLLRQCIDKYGEGKWHLIPSRTGLNRCRKSCRLRWLNYLNPSIKRGKFSSDEVDLLLRLHKLLGNRWSLIAGRLPGRTANDVKNYWNTHLSKKYSYPSCKTDIIEGNPSGSASTPASKVDVIKPQPRSFPNNNSLSGINSLPEVDIHDSITCTKDKEKYELVENVMDGDSMWWESLLKENGGVDTVDPTAMATDEAGTSLMNSSSSMFDIDTLWSMFNEETMELD